MQVFKYKFDQDGYFVKYKAKLCARSDLQQTQQDTYATTLVVQIFCALMAIVVVFDLKIQQYDVVNAFTNSPIDKTIYYYPSDRWIEMKKNANIFFLLLQALYGLKQSLVLWYCHFSYTLIEMGLEHVSRINCFFHNQYMLVFFFVNNIVVLYHQSHMAHLDEFQTKLFHKYKM